MRIFLIGFMGSGKTTLGKQLASRLGYRFIDQDDAIEKRLHKTVPQIFESEGENKFRETERDVIREMAETDNVVVATGGGAPCFFDNIQVMNKIGVSVYIKVDPKTLVNRLKKSPTERPLIKGKDDEELLRFVTAKLNERDAFYSKATTTVQSSNLKVEDILMVLQHHTAS